MKALLVVLKVFAVLALLTMVAAASNAHPWLIEGLLHCTNVSAPREELRNAFPLESKALSRDVTQLIREHSTTCYMLCKWKSP